MIVHFTISAEGRIEDVEILKSPDEFLAKEVVRTVSNAGLWEPGTQDGKKVRQGFVIPVIFMLQ
jgi:periplasmic protein TonB